MKSKAQQYFTDEHKLRIERTKIQQKSAEDKAKTEARRSIEELRRQKEIDNQFDYLGLA